MTNANLKRAKEKAQAYGFGKGFTLTREEFVAAMRAGWRKLDYTEGYFFRVEDRPPNV